MDRGEILPLVRSSHIFASTIREVLELGVLREAGAASLRPSQVRVLKLLSLNGAYQLNRVAAFLGVSSPAAVGGGAERIHKCHRPRMQRDGINDGGATEVDW